MDEFIDEIYIRPGLAMNAIPLCLLLVKKSLIYMEVKSMTLMRKGTTLSFIVIAPLSKSVILDYYDDP